MPQPPSPLTGTPPPAPPKRDWKVFATEEAIRQGVDPELVHRMIQKESIWNPTTISPMGAEGMMQLMPDTARSLGVKNSFDPEENIRAGVRYFKKQMDTHRGKPNQIALSLAGYNAGPAAVQRFKGVPPYKETINYVRTIDQPPTVELVADDAELIPDDVELIADETPQKGFETDIRQAAGQADRLTPGYPGWVDTLRTLPAAAGSMLSTLSKAGGGLPGAAVGAVLGGAGAAGGEALTMGAERTAYDIGLSGVPPPSPEASMQRLKTAAMVGAGGEFLGRGVGAIANKGMAPFAKSVDPTGLQVKRMFPDALPNQIANSPLLDAATGVAEAGLLGGGKITERKAAMAIQAQQEALGIVHQYGGFISEENAGKVFQEALEGNTEQFRAHAKTLYSAVDEIAEGVQVNLDTLQEFAGSELKRRTGIPGEVSGNRGLRMLQQVARAGEETVMDPEATRAAGLMANSLKVPVKEFLSDPKFAAFRERLGLPDTPMAKDMGFDQARAFRSDLTSFIRQATREKDDVARGTAQQLLKRLDVAMDAAADQANPVAKAAYREANAYYKEGMKKYESALMRDLADQYPEEVVDALIGAGKTTPIREARAAIGPEAWTKVQTRVADNIVTKATDEEGQIVGSQLLGELRRLSPATLKEIYPNDEARALWTLGRVLDRSQQKLGATAKVGIYLAQSGAILGVLTGKVSSAALGVFLSPKLLAHIITSKTGAKWLTTGLEAPPGSKMAAQAMRKLAEQTGLNLTGAREPGAIPPPATVRGGPPPAPTEPLRSFRSGPP